MDIRITIPLNPTTKKNSQRILYNSRITSGVFQIRNGRSKYLGVPFIAPSVKFETYQKRCRYFMPQLEKPIEGPVQITCLFYREKRNRCDLTNLLEAVDDILVHYKIIKDDSWNVIRSHDGSRVLFDKESPRTEIIITPYTEEET